ncbi:sugar phosphate isomerase/epimerase family protein [Haladaptatus caseinilyticus]|uniref:sugar phosphate isomerase/epimerase family protein n=1 Tax=Haladaptatus caseinilyticus TaxID=2993314 RepID=UPI00224A731F|nr:sugar phosphate isomerase/epimerase [Haladaptatus caseinilyticus]
MMIRTAIQLYTLNDFDVTEPTKVRIAGETAVEGVELVYDGHPSAETLRALEETELDVAGLTVGLPDLTETLDDVVSACEALECDKIVLGFLDEQYFESTIVTQETAKLLTELTTTLRSHGIQLLYHTHRHEFTSLGDRTHFDLLVDETENIVKFELDLGWIAIAGYDPYKVLETVGDRTVSVHLKDVHVANEALVNLGDGDLDMDRAWRSAVEADIDWLIYEHENPDDPVESVVTGAAQLAKFKHLQASQ